MRTLYIVVVLILIVKCVAVKGEHPRDSSKIYIARYAVYLIGTAITILIIIVVGLIVYVIYLKRKSCGKSTYIDYERNVNICYSRDDTIVSDIFSTPDVTQSKRCLVTRQNSELAFLDASAITNSDINEKRELAQPNKSLPRISPDVNFKCQYMKELKDALLKAKIATSSNSMSDLNKILNEDLEHIEMKLKEEKCSSTPILDIISAPVTPSIIKKVQKKKEIYNDSSEKLANSQCNDTALEMNKNMTDKSSDNVIESVLIHNESRTSVPSLQKSEFNSSSSISLNNDSSEDEVYDNPPSVPKPITSSIDEIYETEPSNRPLTHLITDLDDIDQVYDDPTEVKLSFKKIAKESCALNEDQTTDADLTLYDDTPSKNGQSNKNRVLTKIELQGYILPISEDKKNCVEPYYINANTVKTSQDVKQNKELI